MNSATADIYVVKSGDTLSNIAHRTNKTVSDLARLNEIKNQNKLDIGQVLYLSERKAFSVQALFLDALRHPIDNLKYQLLFDGKTLAGTTGSNGLTEEIITEHGRSRVEVMIQDSYDNWQQLFSTVSGYGKKLIALASPSITFKEQLEEHPPEAPILPEAKKKAPSSAGSKPPLPKAPQGKPSKNNPNVKLNKTKGKKGESVIQIGVDLPQDLLAYMQAYEAEPITEKNWKDFADKLECDVNVLKAIAKVESGGGAAFWTINDAAQHKAHAPMIMFERHYFHRLTKEKYDQTNPDISWKSPYAPSSELNTSNSDMSDGHVDRDDIRDNKQDYLRLINAYRLDEDAALKSASWGKFQIMGANHAICGEPVLKDFVAKMCKNEAGQIEMLAGFIRHNPRQWKNRKDKSLGKEISLWDAVKTKNWQAIAFNYNGPKYKKGKYDEKIKAAYEVYCKKPT